MDIWRSIWFDGIHGQSCRIVFEERGDTLFELLEYEDGERHRFEWQPGGLIRGKGFSRLGLRCIQVPEPVLKEVGEFVGTTGRKVIRNIP